MDMSVMSETCVCGRVVTEWKATTVMVGAWADGQCTPGGTDSWTIRLANRWVGQAGGGWASGCVDGTVQLAGGCVTPQARVILKLWQKDTLNFNR